jgi:hypothetical protein
MGEEKTQTTKTSETQIKTNVLNDPETEPADESVKKTVTTITTTTTSDD